MIPKIGFQPAQSAILAFETSMDMLQPAHLDTPSAVSRDWFQYDLSRQAVPANLCNATGVWLASVGQPQPNLPQAMGMGPFSHAMYKATWTAENDPTPQPVAVKGASSADGKNRLKMEGFYARWAAAGGVSPEVRASDSEAGYLAIAFEAGGRLDPMLVQQPAKRQQVCDALAQLHLLPRPKFVWEINPAVTFQEANGQDSALHKLAERGPPYAPLTMALRHFRDALFDGLEAFAYVPSIVHNDAHYQNIIDGPRGLKLIDFGNTGYGDGLRDLAYHFVFSERPSRELTSWVEDYQTSFAAASKRNGAKRPIGDSPLRRTAHHVAVIRLGRFLGQLAQPSGREEGLTWWRGRQLCEDLRLLSEAQLHPTD